MIKQPVLKTKRLILRKWKISDAEELTKLWNDKEITKWIEGIPYPCDLKKIKSLLRGNEKGAYYFAIFTDKKLIGSIWFRHIDSEYNYELAELGLWIGKSFWGKGYALEASKKLIEWGFKNLKLRKIFAKVNIENNASKELMKKIGFRLEGKLRKQVRIRFEKKICDELYYGLLKEEWKK